MARAAALRASHARRSGCAGSRLSAVDQTAETPPLLRRDRRSPQNQAERAHHGHGVVPFSELCHLRRRVAERLAACEEAAAKTPASTRWSCAWNLVGSSMMICAPTQGESSLSPVSVCVELSSYHTHPPTHRLGPPRFHHVVHSMQPRKPRSAGKARAQHELSKEDREAMEARIRTRVACDKAAYEVQWQLLEPGVSEQSLDEASRIIQPHHYADVVTERAIDGLCGYPPCSSAAPRRGQGPKFQVSLAQHKVYDVSQLHNFCSQECARRSHQYASSLSTVSLFLRDGAVQRLHGADACSQASPLARDTCKFPTSASSSKDTVSKAACQPPPSTWMAQPTNDPPAAALPILKPVAERETCQPSSTFPAANTIGLIEGHQVRYESSQRRMTQNSLERLVAKERGSLAFIYDASGDREP